MGLRCLLGHDFENREVERERQEDGNEVVVTYRTVETCQRCGERRIVSENKEVRSIRSGEEMQTGLGASVTTDADAAPDADDGTAVVDDDSDAVDDPADAIDDAEADGATPDQTVDPEPTADEDDGIILTDDGSSEREHGQWPDADVNRRSDPAVEASAAPGTEDAASQRAASTTDDAVSHGTASTTDDAVSHGTASTTDDAVGGDTGTPSDDDSVILGSDDDWPEHEGEDEGFDAEPGESGGTDVSFGGSFTPESSSAGAANGEATFADAEAETDEPAPDKEFVRADDASVEIDRNEPGRRTEFYCPNCGLSRSAGASSMRAGDICPECRKGYIAERDA
jgi:predicted RNA-binding Zn-ribbon protein involved in translation (DUF1610 family)